MSTMRADCAHFGSYGWLGGAVKTVEEKLEKAGIEIVAPATTVKWILYKNEIQTRFEFGREFAKKVTKIEQF